MAFPTIPDSFTTSSTEDGSGVGVAVHNTDHPQPLSLNEEEKPAGDNVKARPWSIWSWARIVSQRVADAHERNKEAQKDIEALGNVGLVPHGDDINPLYAERLRWKIDYHVYPILFIIYALSFLDRINISNARIQGLTEDLELYGNRYNVVLFVYFIPYILLEIPSNMIIKRVRPSLYLSSLMFCWGVVNMSMGFVKTYGQLIILRILLGVFEAGVLPGIIYLTSMYYKRHDFQLRMSSFFCSIVVAGAFGGLLAYAIADLDGHYDIRAWRWIFIIEGAATAFISFLAVFFIVDWPHQCRFLNADEKILLQKIMDKDNADEARMDTLNKQACKLIFTDWKIWTGSIMYMGIGITGYSLVFFMPTILVEFGWKARQAQIHSIPIYAVTAVFMILVAWMSDRLKHRYLFILFGCTVASIGYSVLLAQASLSRDTKYAALFLASIGGYIATPMALAWLSNNVSGHWKRAFASGIQVTIGNVVGLVASNVFLDREAPRYTTGYSAALGFTCLGGLAATALFVGMLLENRKREAGERDDRLLRPIEEVRNMGDYHPSFRFSL